MTMAMFIVVFISVISLHIFFTGNSADILSGNIKKAMDKNLITGFVVYDYNPDVEVVIPDVDLKDRYGYFTGHQELAERPDNKFDITISSSPGIPKLVHIGEMPEAVVEIKGYNSNNESVQINSLIDTFDEDDDEYGFIKSAVLAIDSIEIENATITLPKTHHVEYILECDDFDQENFVCLDNGGWYDADIPFTDNGDTITFVVTHFTGYAGGGSNESDSANLTIWDNMDQGMFHGDDEKYVLEEVEFFSNYSMLNGSTIGSETDGSGVTCIINFSDGENGIMNFVGAYQLYEYDRTFNSAGIFDYNVSCDGSLLGFVELNTTDNVTISSLTPPKGMAGAAPSVTIPIFNETSVNATQNINASVNYTDDEGDSGTLYFNWFVNDSWVFEEIVTSVANNSNISRQFDAGNYSDRANITIEVTPYDGNSNGTSKNSTFFMQVCLNPYNDMSINMDTILCSGTYNIADSGSSGVIITSANSINITCDGTRIVGAMGGVGIDNGNTFNIIKGCTFEKYTNGIYIDNTNNTVENCTLLSNTNGVVGFNWHNNITNNTFYNNSNGFNTQTGNKNNYLWGNRFLGEGSNTDGIYLFGGIVDPCPFGLYGNYYDINVGSTKVQSTDCGPSPNATVMLYDKSEQYNWTFGSTGTATFNNLAEAMYNIGPGKTLYGAYYSGTFYENTSTIKKDNIIFDCNGTMFDDRVTGSSTAITFGSHDWITIRNCTFNRYWRAINIDSGSTNNTIENSTFLSSTSFGVGTYDNHNNVTNNTFYNNSDGYVSTTGVFNNNVWGNRFLGSDNADGITLGGGLADFCPNDIYGNYYDINVGITKIELTDCGPTPNATIMLYDKSEQYNWSWGSTGTSTYNNLAEAVYNIESTDTILGAPYSGTFFKNTTTTVKDTITLDCNGIVFDDRSGSDTAISFVDETFWTIRNCTFKGYQTGINFDLTSHNNTVENSTFLSSAVRGIYINQGDHNNITNNTFFNNTEEGINLASGSKNTLVWGNRFLGNNNDGISNSDSTTNLCVDDGINYYGNYYDNFVD
ncbi:MAG: NosD domain-containing protein, partial [Candidatus Woesearchaeota archaeon]